MRPGRHRRRLAQHDEADDGRNANAKEDGEGRNFPQVFASDFFMHPTLPGLNGLTFHPADLRATSTDRDRVFRWTALELAAYFGDWPAVERPCPRMGVRVSLLMANSA